MKPVSQRLLAIYAPDCFAACIASIFEVPLEWVPRADCREFKDGIWQLYIDRLQRQFLSPRGFQYMHTAVPDWGSFEQWSPSGYSILTGSVAEVSTPDQLVRHSVVAYKREIVWDPAPDQPLLNGYHLEPPFFWGLFIANDPAIQQKTQPNRRERRNPGKPLKESARYYCRPRRIFSERLIRK